MCCKNVIIIYGNNTKKNTEPLYHYRVNVYYVIIFEHIIMCKCSRERISGEKTFLIAT